MLLSEAALRGEGVWAPLSTHAPFDVLFVALAVPLAAFAVRSKLHVWELPCFAAFATFTLHAGRNSVWLIFLLAAPAARGLGQRHVRSLVITPRALVLCSWVPAALFIAGVLQPPPDTGAGERVRREAATLAAGRPILADGLDAERLALEGQRVWIANPLDAFAQRDQRLYLDWIDATPAGDSLLTNAGSVVLVTRGSASQRRLARDPGFRRVAHDSHAAVYVRTVQMTERREDVHRAVVIASARTRRAGS